MTTPEEDPFNDEHMQAIIASGRYDFSPSDTTATPEDGEAFNATVANILSPGKAPEIPAPGDDDSVRLPGGLVTPDGVVRTAQVRELTGEDEEQMAKALGNPVRFTNALLRAVVSIGEEPANPKMLRELLVGDREALLLGIRCATFGKDVVFSNVECPGCGELLQITVDLTQLETVELEDPEQREFEVPLRNGSALVRFPTGADSDRVAEHNGTVAEGNSMLLSRCVISINGTKVNNNLELVRNLGLSDRRTLIDFLAEKAPGPRYDEVKSKHESCGTEIPLHLAADELFRGF